MKSINIIILSLILMLILISGCQKENPVIPGNDSPLALKPNFTYDNPFTVTFIGVTGNTWSYEIQKTSSGNALSHWTIALGPCLYFANIVEATIDGIVWTDIDSTEGIGTGCDIPADKKILKFDDLPDSISNGNVHIFTFTLNVSVNTNLDSMWLKAGQNCYMEEIIAPGCTEDEGCSYSQGYYFAKPNLIWDEDVTIGSFIYSQEEGRAIFRSSNKGGIKDAKKAFLQIAAIQLSGDNVSPSAGVWADYWIAYNYIAGLTDKLSPAYLPTGTPESKEAAEAAGRIGDWIDDHHCGAEAF